VVAVTLTDRNLGPPRQAGEAPIQEIDTPPELTSPVDDLTKSIRQPVVAQSGAAKIYTLMDARDEEITS
jgi:hypothetical protein